MSLVDESSIDWTLLEYNMYVYVYLFIYLCVYLFTYLIKTCWTCWGLQRNDVANQIYCTVFHEAISFCNISRDNHLHQGFIALCGDKTWLVACPNLRHVGSRDWPGRPSQNGTCNVEKIWKSFRITFRYEEWIIWVCSKSTNVLSNEWVALSPNKWRNFCCSSLLCGNNHITPRVPLRLHWDWILTHTYVYNGQKHLIP